MLGPPIADLAAGFLERSGGGGKSFPHIVDHVLDELVRQTLERDPRFVRSSMGGWALATQAKAAEKHRLSAEREANEEAAGLEPAGAHER